MAHKKNSKKNDGIWSMILICLMVVILLLTFTAIHMLRNTDFSKFLERKPAVGGAEETEWPKNTAGSGIVVPDITGMKEEEAKTMLNGMALGAKAAGEEYTDDPPGTVVRQTPEAGEHVEAHTTILYYVSASEMFESVPDVRGKHLKDAVAELNDHHYYQIRLKKMPSTSQSCGTVTAQTPEPGSGLGTGDELTLTVSTGSREGTTYANNYLGEKEKKAVSKAADDGLIAFVEYGWSDLRKDGRVIAQSVDPGAHLASGAEVTLIVNKKDAIQPKIGWNTKVLLGKPTDYTGNTVRFVIRQTLKDGTFYEHLLTDEIGEPEFPFELNAEGVEEGGTVTMYEYTSEEKWIPRANWDVG